MSHSLSRSLVKPGEISAAHIQGESCNADSAQKTEDDFEELPVFFLLFSKEGNTRRQGEICRHELKIETGKRTTWKQGAVLLVPLIFFLICIASLTLPLQLQMVQGRPRKKLLLCGRSCFSSSSNSSWRYVPPVFSLAAPHAPSGWCFSSLDGSGWPISTEWACLPIRADWALSGGGGLKETGPKTKCLRQRLKIRAAAMDSVRKMVFFLIIILWKPFKVISQIKIMNLTMSIICL